MSSCPHCHNSIDSQAIRCPYCHKSLKAYGHPGIPLYQATQDEFLCDRCLYHEDDSCNYPQRPYAKTCTLYHDKSQPLIIETIPSLAPAHPLKAIQLWCLRHRGLLLIIGLILMSFLIALLR